jgi:MFS family permease
MSYKSVHIFGRKKLFVIGQIGMGLFLLLTSISINLKFSSFSVLFMLMFLIVYQSTMGPTHWIYIPEICTDAQFGFVATIHYLNGVEIGLTTEYMIEYFKPEGTFLLFAIITLLGAIFMQTVVIETRGLIDAQKKQLYAQ